MELQDIHFILNHFQGAGPIFPRTISTNVTRNKQLLVTSIEEIYDKFKAADFVDCRINAYPGYTNFQGINRQYPAFVMCDLDFVKFRTEKLLLKALHNTTQNIALDLGESARPTVLFTGNGYHVYQPIKLPILEQESLFEVYQNPSTEFIRYAAQKWTEGKNDPCNHPSVNSCMVRVPNSVNSDNNKTVEIVESWNGIRPAANSMLFKFQIELAAKKLARPSYKNRTSRSVDGNIYITKGKRIHRWKNYRRYGYTNRSQRYQTVDWIEKTILAGPGIADHRKATMELVLAPYLVNVRKCDHDTAYNTIAEWLDKCAKIRRLDFNARLRISYALKRAKDGDLVYPMRQDTMKQKYRQMYAEIFSPMEQ